MAESGADDLVVIARAVRTHGLKGEIVAELLTDFPERFDDVDELILVSPVGERKSGQLENHWFQKDRVVLKFAGFDDVDRAKELVGYEFAVPESERVPLDEDEFYDWELEGCTVKVADKRIGEVRSVMRTGGAAAVLVVADGSGKELLVPLAAEIVGNIDPAAKVILIDPPEGLLDL